MTASAFSLGLVAPREGFALVQGTPEPHAKTAEPGNISTRQLCPVCASWTHTELAASPDIMVVRPSSLDEPSWFRPVAQLYTRSAHRWAVMPLPFSAAAELEDMDAVAEAFRLSDIRPEEPA